MTLNSIRAKLGDYGWRKKMFRYWVNDTFWGMMDYVGHYGLRILPIDVAASVAKILGVISGRYRYKNVDHRIRQNLSALIPRLSDNEINRMSMNMWKNLGQVMGEYSFFDKLHKENRVILENTENLPAIKLNPQAVIFVTVHTGNWEICGNYVTDYGFDLMCVYKPVRNRFSRRIADKARARMGGVIKLVDAEDPAAMRKICKHLAEKGAFWIALDEFKDGQVHGPRLGRPLQLANTNAGFAVRLAQRYDAVIIPVFNLRHEGSRFTTSFGEPVYVRKNEASSIEALAKLDAIFEAWVLAHIDQWYMLHELRLNKL